jgi:hypothetical protein
MKLTPEEKSQRAADRKRIRAEQKELARVESEKNQKPVKKLTINIEWRRSRTYGNTPHASVSVEFHDGTYAYTDGYTAYDTESTVIAEIFNMYLHYKLWNLSADKRKGGHGSLDEGPAPYGINNYGPNSLFYAGGVGMSSYYRISEYIGGKLENIASGKTFDVYVYSEEE